MDDKFCLEDCPIEARGSGNCQFIVGSPPATERQQEWQKKLGITRPEVEELVMNPAQIVPGDLGAFVAQTRRGRGLLRLPFAQVGDDCRILTVYWTSKVDKYWKGE